MADEKPALVVHLAYGGEPLLFALDPEQAGKIGDRLGALLKSGGVESIPTRDGQSVAINFTHVAAAYLDDLQRKGRVFGLH